MMRDKAVFGIPEGKFAPENRKHQGIPGIETLPNGRIFICYYCNSEPWEGPGSYLVVTVGDDGGRSWLEVGIFAPPRSGLRIYDAVLWRSPDGILRIYWSQCSSAKAGDIFDGRAGVWTSECTDEEAGRPVWSEPRRIADGVMPNKPTVLRNGSWALPVALWSVCPGKMQPELAGLYRSNLLLTDDGASWYGNLLLNPAHDVSYPDLAEGEDGFIYAVYDHGRTEHGQIFLARFTERDIAAGEFIVPDSSGGILAASFDR